MKYKHHDGENQISYRQIPAFHEGNEPWRHQKQKEQISDIPQRASGGRGQIIAHPINAKQVRKRQQRFLQTGVNGKNTSGKVISENCERNEYAGVNRTPCQIRKEKRFGTFF